MIVQDSAFLSQVSQPVESIAEGIEICKKLEDEIANSKSAVGLSAPQIGILKRCFISRIDGNVQHWINPQIASLSNPFLFKGEGCLSFPGTYLELTGRYEKVTISDLISGEQELSGFQAVVAQHEMDHLDGIVMFAREIKDLYQQCFCGSGKKTKFCCRKGR